MGRLGRGIDIGPTNISISFKPRDLWIGVYDKEPFWAKRLYTHNFYICLVPAFPIKISYKRSLNEKEWDLSCLWNSAFWYGYEKGKNNVLEVRGTKLYTKAQQPILNTKRRHIKKTFDIPLPPLDSLTHQGKWKRFKWWKSRWYRWTN